MIFFVPEQPGLRCISGDVGHMPVFDFMAKKMDSCF